MMASGLPCRAAAATQLPKLSSTSGLLSSDPLSLAYELTATISPSASDIRLTAVINPKELVAMIGIFAPC